MLVACLINYTERVYKRVSKLANEERVNFNWFQIHSLGISSQQVYSLLLLDKVGLQAVSELASE